MKYHVYILQSLKDNGYYIGSCKNVEARLKFHNKGLQRSTRNRIPFTLAYTEEQPSKTAAIKRERQIKNYKGGNAFKKLIGTGSGPAWGEALVWGARGRWFESSLPDNNQNLGVKNAEVLCFSHFFRDHHPQFPS